MADMLARSVGRHLRQLRLKRGISQTVLADRALMSRSYVSDLERGNFDVTLATLARICVVLQITLKEFIQGLEL